LVGGLGVDQKKKKGWVVREKKKGCKQDEERRAIDKEMKELGGVCSKQCSNAAMQQAGARRQGQ
jgi:hypothetical protein